MKMLICALLLATTASSGNMAALIGHDRVTATYPGFRKIEGDTAALAAHGVSGTDAIIIRKVAVLSPAQTAAFGLSDAIKIATASAHRTTDNETNTPTPFSNAQKLTICGRTAFGFTRSVKVRIPAFAGPPIAFTEFDTFVLALVQTDVWQAEYMRPYDRGLERQGPSLIDFTSKFCVQKNYS